MRALLYIDGCCPENPGPMGIGVVVLDPASYEPLARISGFAGYGTNNVAEYLALIRGLEACLDRSVKQLTAFTDSKLLFRQMTGKALVRTDHLLDLYRQALALSARFDAFQCRWVPRTKNRRADFLARKGLKAKRQRWPAGSGDQNNRPGHQTDKGGAPTATSLSEMVRLRAVIGKEERPDAWGSFFVLVASGGDDLREDRQIYAARGVRVLSQRRLRPGVRGFWTEYLVEVPAGTILRVHNAGGTFGRESGGSIRRALKHLYFVVDPSVKEITVYDKYEAGVLRGRLRHVLLDRRASSSPPRSGDLSSEKTRRENRPKNPEKPL